MPFIIFCFLQKVLSKLHAANLALSNVKNKISSDFVIIEVLLSA